MSEREGQDSSPQSADADGLVEEITERYLDQLHAGQVPDRQTLLSVYPDLAARLTRELDLIETLYGAARTRSGEIAEGTSGERKGAAPDSRGPERPAGPGEVPGGVPVPGSGPRPRR